MNFDTIIKLPLLIMKILSYDKKIRLAPSRTSQSAYWGVILHYLSSIFQKSLANLR